MLNKTHLAGHSTLKRKGNHGRDICKVAKGFRYTNCLTPVNGVDQNTPLVGGFKLHAPYLPGKSACQQALPPNDHLEHAHFKTPSNDNPMTANTELCYLYNLVTLSDQPLKQTFNVRPNRVILRLLLFYSHGS